MLKSEVWSETLALDSKFESGFQSDRYHNKKAEFIENLIFNGN
jgi:hypothetical protein